MQALFRLLPVNWNCTVSQIVGQCTSMQTLKVCCVVYGIVTIFLSGKEEMHLENIARCRDCAGELRGGTAGTGACKESFSESRGDYARQVTSKMESCCLYGCAKCVIMPCASLRDSVEKVCCVQCCQILTGGRTTMCYWSLKETHPTIPACKS